MTTNMTDQEIEQMKKEWEKLDKEYDDYIKDIAESSDEATFTEERIEKMKAMQEELNALETKLFKAIERRLPAKE